MAAREICKATFVTQPPLMTPGARPKKARQPANMLEVKLLAASVARNLTAFAKGNCKKQFSASQTAGGFSCSYLVVACPRFEARLVSRTVVPLICRSARQAHGIPFPRDCQLEWCRRHPGCRLVSFHMRSTCRPAFRVEAGLLPSAVEGS